MKNIIPFILIVFAFSCSEEKIEKAIEEITKPQFDTLTIGAKVYNMQDLADSNFTFDDFDFTEDSDSLSIEKSKDVASRHGDTLFLKCDNGRIVKLKNINSDGDDMEYFSFAGLNKDINGYVVSRMRYEYYDVLIINKHTGDSLFAIGYPVVSPNKQQFVCVNMDMEAGFTTNGIQLFKIENDMYISVGLRELNNWGPEKVMWKNDSTLIVNVVERTNEGVNRSYYKVLYIKSWR